MKNLRIIIINIHGLLKSTGLEIGRDADNGGQTRYVYELAEYLSRHEDVRHVHLFTRLIEDPGLDETYSLPVEIINDKLDIRRIPFAGKRYRMKEELWSHLDEFVANALQYIKTHDLIPDWMHSHYGDAGYVATELATLLGIPFAHTGHSLGIDKREKVNAMGMTSEEGERKFKFSQRISAEDNLLAKTEFVITSTDQELDTYRKYSNFELASFKTLPPGVDTEKFVPYYQVVSQTEVAEDEFERKYWVGEYIEKFLSNPHKPTILSLSRPDRRKNLHTLIEVFGKDKELQSLANLVIFAGIRKDIEKMPENEQDVLVQILLLMDKYDLYGKLAIPKKHDVENEVATIYRYCAEKRGVFVNLTLHENFGLTLIEAASTGLPVVSTKNGGPAEIIPKCKNGILVDPMDYAEISQAIKHILIDEDKWRDYSIAGIHSIQKYYSWKSHIDKYVGWIKKALTTHKKVSTPKIENHRLKQATRLFATDIDGTLLSEDHDNIGLQELVSFLQNRPEDLAFAYASGRSIKLVKEVVEEFNLPLPDLIVCAVGSQIYYNQDQDFIIDKGWSSYLSKNWNRREILRRISNLDWVDLQEQEGQNLHKISFYLKNQLFKADQLDSVLGKYRDQVTIILSHDLYLDVLPKKASKGKALRYICRKWSIPYRNLYTAGDSGNDLDMLTGSGNGIIVGNHAQELGSLVVRKNLYRASHPAAAGILEGLEHFGITPSETWQDI
ncbi:MAG: HAD-IIB family hydrolase [Saprospiraceae bacterium]|nr:HAD-IIB family hydrolase [Saprospiraceae bacterium]